MHVCCWLNMDKEGGTPLKDAPKPIDNHPLTLSTDRDSPLLLPSASSSSSHDTSSTAAGRDDHVTSKDSGPHRPRFYFESDTLALKNNPDYHLFLKTLAILEAQKMQAIRDVEALLHAQSKAEADPIKFVQSLKDGTLEPLPRRQQVAEIPNIEWKPYIDSLQKVAKQHSTIYLNTRHHSNRPLISSLDEKSVVSKPKDPNKPASFGQQWTVEEQAKFEELLKIYPPEPVDRRRFKKIAKALGTRTTQQVATHVQKYFIKLAHAGLPVPGRVPSINKYPKKKGKGKGKRSLKRPSTFFSSLMPHVLMKEEPSTGTPPPPSETSNFDSSDEDSVLSEMISGEHLGGGVDEDEEGETSGSSSPHLPTPIRCVSCAGEVEQGVYWQCSECPKATPTFLCNDCINIDYTSECHSPSHNMQLLSLAPPHTFFGSEETPSSFMDKDYTNFSSHNSQTGYNYLDPNFYPAS